MKVLMFAAARQFVGLSEIDLDVESPTTVAAVKSAMTACYPDLANLISTSRIAIDQNFADDQMRVFGHEEIALIPPVSGG